MKIQTADSDAWSFGFPGSVYGKEDGTVEMLAIAWWSVVDRDGGSSGEHINSVWASKHKIFAITWIFEEKHGTPIEKSCFLTFLKTPSLI